MVPKSYTVGNFKAIGSPQTIDLRPITLIFGKNSAGKSSIIQSLLLCRHAVEKGNFNFASTKRWGQVIDLGDFRQYVHRHETERDLILEFSFSRTAKERQMSVLEAQLDRAMSVDFGVGDAVPLWSFFYLNTASEISVRLEIGQSSIRRGKADQQPIRVKRVEISVDGKALMGFAQDRGGDLHFQSVNLEHELLISAMALLASEYLDVASIDAGEQVKLEQLAEESGAEAEHNPAFSHVCGRIRAVRASCSSAVGESAFKKIEPHLKEESALARLFMGVSTALEQTLQEVRLQGDGLKLKPRRKEPIEAQVQLETEPGIPSRTPEGSILEDGPVRYYQLNNPGLETGKLLARCLRYDLVSVVLALFEALEFWLKNTEYIGPYRSIPGRFFQVSQAHEGADIDQGYLALRDLAKKPALLREVSEIFQETLDSPYQMEVRTVAPSLDQAKLQEALARCVETVGTKEKGQLKKEIANVIDKLSEGKTVQGLHLIDKRNETAVDFCDVGFGIGQVLPLVVEVATRRAGLVCIEQPEVHLHPKMQSDLGDVFVREVSRERSEGKIFFLETHSEGLILRLLRRVRETTEAADAGKVLDFPLKSSDVGVHWVEMKDGEALVSHLGVTEDGDFDRKWPEGFFEERFEDLP